MPEAALPQAKHRVSSKFWFLVYGLAYLALGVLLCRLAMPLMPYDEIGHYAYIEILSNHDHFPFMVGSEKIGLPSHQAIETHQAHQPPVYYLALTPFAKVAGIGPDLSPNPRSLLILRYATFFLFGISFAIGAYLIFRNLNCQPNLLPHLWGASLLVPTLPGCMTTLTNDAAVIAFSTLGIAFLIRGGKSFWWGALCIGLAFGSKAFAMFLFPALALAAILKIKSQPTKTHFLKLGWAIFCLGLFGGLWFLRNTHLYGHPFATGLVKEFLISTSTMNPTDPVQVMKWCKDFFTQFFHVGPFYRGTLGTNADFLFLGLCVPIGLTILWSIGLSLKQKVWQKQPYLLLGILTPLVGAGLIFLNSIDIYAPSGRYLLLAWPISLSLLTIPFEKYSKQILFVVISFNATCLVTLFGQWVPTFWKTKDMVWSAQGWIFTGLLPF